MPRCLRCASFALMLAVVVLPARAELPSLMSEAADRPASVSKPQASSPSLLRSVDAWRRGKIYLSRFGALHYRFSGAGLNADVYYAGAATRALIGYGGERRLELIWPAHGASVKLAYVDEDGESGYRLEFVHDF